MSRQEIGTKIQSEYTRREFVDLEIKMGIGMDAGYPEELDTDIVDAIRQRAEWNAQAAERAGVVWRADENAEVLWECPKSPEWYGHRITADGGIWNWYDDATGWVRQVGSWHPALGELARRLVAEYRSSSQVGGEGKSVTVPARTANQAWIEYCDSGNARQVGGVPRFVFNYGFDYGYEAGKARMREWLRQKGSGTTAEAETVAETETGYSASSKFTEIEDEIEYLNSQLAELANTINGELGRQRRSLETLVNRAHYVDNRMTELGSRVAKVESEWVIQGQKYTTDLRMTREQVTKASQLIEQWQREMRECDAGLNNDRLKLEARVENLEVAFGQMHLEFGQLEANVEGLADSANSVADLADSTNQGTSSSEPFSIERGNSEAGLAPGQEVDRGLD